MTYFVSHMLPGNQQQHIYVLRPYFVSPCRKWHKKGSSPRNYSNAEVLRPRDYSNVVGFHGRGFIAMSWVLRPWVNRNVHSRLLTIYSRLLMILEPLYLLSRSFTYLLDPFRAFGTYFLRSYPRLFTISHDWGCYIATFLLRPKASKGFKRYSNNQQQGVYSNVPLRTKASKGTSRGFYMDVLFWSTFYGFS